METVRLTLDDIIQMTLQVGEKWAVAHAKRLIELTKQIGADIPYDSHIMELAAYMHDWGAFPKYSKRMWNMPSAHVRWWRQKSCRVWI